MPARSVLPNPVIDYLPERAQQQLVERAPFESYSTVAYSGVNGGVAVTGLFVEVDADT